jgi:hypothetical protein
MRGDQGGEWRSVGYLNLSKHMISRLGRGSDMTLGILVF